MLSRFVDVRIQPVQTDGDCSFPRCSQHTSPVFFVIGLQVPSGTVPHTPDGEFDDDV